MEGIEQTHARSDPEDPDELDLIHEQSCIPSDLFYGSSRRTAIPTNVEAGPSTVAKTRVQPDDDVTVISDSFVSLDTCVFSMNLS